MSIRIAIITICLGVPFAVQAYSFGDPLVPEDCNKSICGFRDFFQLVKNVIDYGILIAPLIAGIVLAYAGWMFMWARGNSAKVDKAKGILQNTLFGLILVLGAFYIVKFVLAALQAADFIRILG